MRIAREEIFGPVLSILTYQTEEEGIALANDTPYGLGGAVWSKDREKALAVAAKCTGSGPGRRAATTESTKKLPLRPASGGLYSVPPR